MGMVWTFLLSSILFLLSPSLLRAARYRLKYRLKVPLNPKRGWSGGAKVLGKLSVPGRLTSLDDGRARAYCACSRCGWGFVWTFFLSSIFFSFLSPSLWETARYRLKYCLKGPLKPKQPTNQNKPKTTNQPNKLKITNQPTFPQDRRDTSDACKRQ